jgi:hypothetical protein
MHVARWVLIGGFLTVLVGGILTSFVAQGAWNRVRTRPLDMTQVQHHIGIQAPHTVTSFVKRDGIAFRAHAFLADVIERANGAPSAVGVQWVKAAAHARTDSELRQVVHGLQWSVQHSTDSSALQSTLCTYVESGWWTGLQREAFQAANLECPIGRQH